MGAVNKAIIVGNLGKDPELRHTQSGTAVANFSVATNEKWTDRNGQKQERTEWHRCVAWGKLAEVVNEYLSKGSQVYLEGTLQTRDWTDRDGNDRSTTEIKVLDVQFLGGGQRREGPPPQQDPGGPYPQDSPDEGITDDDIPF